jgi:hypothetical protein
LLLSTKLKKAQTPLAILLSSFKSLDKFLINLIVDSKSNIGLEKYNLFLNSILVSKYNPRVPLALFSRELASVILLYLTKVLLIPLSLIS